MAGAADEEILAAARELGGEAVEAAAPVVKRGVREILGEGDYGILSAANPAGKVLSAEENALRHSNLMQRLRDSGYEPLEQVGVYGGNPEPSFLVPGLTPDLTKQLGREFEQEAVISAGGWHRLADNADFPRTALDFDQTADNFYSELVDPASGQRLKYQLGFPDEAYGPPSAPSLDTTASPPASVVDDQISGAFPPSQSSTVSPNDLLRQEAAQDLSQRYPGIVERLHNPRGAEPAPLRPTTLDPLEGTRPEPARATATMLGPEFQVLENRAPGAPAIVRLDSKLVKGLGSLARGIQKTDMPGVYALHPQIKDRVAQLIEIGQRVSKSDWRGVNEELLEAFGGDERQALRWAQLWGATSPNTDVGNNTMESVAMTAFNLQKPGKLISVRQAQTLTPRKITMAPSKVPNIKRALQDQPLGNPKVDRMGRFMMGEDGALPIDVHTLHGLGSKTNKFDEEIPALRAKMTRAERLPERGGLTEHDIYDRVEHALRTTLEELGGSPVNPKFASFWEGVRHVKGLKQQGGPVDILRKKGLLKEAAMLDPKQLRDALKKAGWTAGAIAMVVRAASAEAAENPDLKRLQLEANSRMARERRDPNYPSEERLNDRDSVGTQLRRSGTPTRGRDITLPTPAARSEKARTAAPMNARVSRPKPD